MSAPRYHKPSPLMAIQLHTMPVTRLTDGEETRYTCFHEILQAPTAQLPPVVEFLIVEAPVLVFVSFVADAPAGIKVTSKTREGVDAISVRVHSDTGLAIYGRASKISNVLVEIFLPKAFQLRVVECQGSGKVVLEDKTLLVNDPYADIHIHQAGEGEVFVTTCTDMNVNSLTWEPHGGAIHFSAPTVTVRDSFHAKITAVGSLDCVVAKLKGPLLRMETAGYGSIQVSATEMEVMAKLNASATGASSIQINAEYSRVDQISSSTSGQGNITAISEKELHVNFMACTADGESQTSFASHNGVANETRISVAGNATVDARDVLAREANIHVAGAGTVLFQASEVAHTQSNGYGTATLTGSLPPRITGRPILSPELPLLIDSLIPSQILKVTLPSRGDAFQPQPQAPGFLASMKSLWTGGPCQDGTKREP